MKKMRKILVLMLAMVMLLSLSITAFATEPDPTAAPTKGSITVQNATKGYEYNAYKVFDATYDGTKVSYKTPEANAALLDDTLFGWSTADKDGNISVWMLDTADEEDVIDWVKENYAAFGGTAIPGVFDDTNSTVTFSDLDFGYYYITSGLGSAVTIDSAAPTATVIDKNTATPVDPVKKIIAVDGTTVDNLEEADAHVGSVVTFKVTAATTNWEDEDTIRAEWTTADAATNMFVDPQSIKVKVNDTEITNFTAAGDGNGGFILNIPLIDADGNSIYPANLGANPGQIPIEITYDAVILEEAAGEPATNEIGGSIVKIYTYAFQVAKTDGTNPLPGAQFELWANGAALTFIDNGNGTYTYYKKTGENDTTTVTTTLDMTTNTTISILGLDNKWSYTLKEITVPAGYNPAEDIDIAGSSLTKVTDGMDTSMSSTALYKETVVNNQGVELPSTGGIGTTIFYIVGGVMLLGAAVVLISKKRMHE